MKQELGNYRILRKLGEGGMGVVYLAEHTLIGRRAAIKVLQAEKSKNADLVQRFFNEARAAGMLRHPGLVDVYDLGFQEDGSAYIVMEFLDGEALSRRIRREGPLAAPLVCGIGRQIAHAVGAAHARGIVHRDLKPPNVFLLVDRDVPLGVRAKVLDFGIAKLQGEVPQGVHTQTGSIVGTPAFMSPEQAKGAGQVDHRSDIYSLGCILFNMACGRPPFVREGQGEILAAHIFESPPHPRTLIADVPEALEITILRCLEKSPAARPQTMEELASLLDPTATPVHVGRASASSPGLSASQQREPTTKYDGPPELELPKPATLAEAAGEVRPPAQGRSGLALGLGFAAVAAGAAVAVVLWKTGDSGELPPPPPPVFVQRTVPAEVAPAPAPAPEPTPPSPTEVMIRIESTPSGAEVYRAADGILLGETPFEQRLAAGAGQAAYVVRAEGYKAERVRLPVERDGVARVTLVKTRSRATTPKPPPEVPGPKPRTKDGALDPFGD